MLNQEEKVREVLDYAYTGKSSESASAIQIPRFLPHKVFFFQFGNMMAATKCAYTFLYNYIYILLDYK